MATTYAQLQKQIASLTREAERLKRDEVDGVIARIKEAIQTYGLTSEDLGLGRAKRGRKSRPQANGNGAPAPRAAKRGRSKAKVNTEPKFRDEAGNTWVGRGPRPQWLRDALAGGKQLEDFAVGA